MRQPKLFAGESLCERAGFPYLTYYRAGSKDKPLVIFSPGGGHLARVVYGHDGANREDFLDYWLESLGYGLLAISYPSDHPIFERPYPEMSVSDWGKSLASVVAAFIDEKELSPRIILVGWSMSGRLVSTFAQAARELKLESMCFISLAASIPMPGILQRQTGVEPLTPEGLWDFEGTWRPAVWEKNIEEINRTEGHPVISLEDYRAFYRCNNPIQLRGEADRFQNGARFVSTELAINDVRPFDYSQFPICAAIAPAYPLDSRHALTDGVSWAFYTIYSIVLGRFAGRNLMELSEIAWDELRDLVTSIPQRLTRYSPGGHFFFLGKKGASVSAQYIDELVLEVAKLEEKIKALAGLEKP
ncbi:hypothetical protein AB0H36_39895 [Kribbella sp. NPDC050820]|uniref:alpha/beta fold hydrolase n=1 Tax=Kribbella sp. NPDC050820 TaxID=3155408 RepID=UPI0033E49829